MSELPATADQLVEAINEAFGEYPYYAEEQYERPLPWGKFIELDSHRGGEVELIIGTAETEWAVLGELVDRYVWRAKVGGLRRGTRASIVIELDALRGRILKARLVLRYHKEGYIYSIVRK